MKILDLAAEVQGRRRKLRTLRVGNAKSEENIKNKIQRAAEGGWIMFLSAPFFLGETKSCIMQVRWRRPPLETIPDSIQPDGVLACGPSFIIMKEVSAI